MTREEAIEILINSADQLNEGDAYITCDFGRCVGCGVFHNGTRFDDVEHYSDCPLVPMRKALALLKPRA